MDKKIKEKERQGFWYRFWHPKGTVGEPWMTDEELMRGPHIKNFFENGDAKDLLDIIKKNNQANGKGS